MKKYVVIAPVGDNLEGLFVGIREFLTERVIMISPTKQLDKAEKTKKELEKFKIPTKIIEIKGDIWEETFKTVAEIKGIEKNKEVIINVSTGDTMSRCAATSAAFVNGLKAFSVEGSDVMLLPVLKFSYYKMLTDKKMQMLKMLSDKNCCASLEELSKKSGMSLPLVSYHINGNLKSEGLKGLGLVETTEEKGKTAVTLSMLGRMLLKGYVS